MNFLDPWVFLAGIPLLGIAVFVWLQTGTKRRKLLLRWFGSGKEVEKHLLFSPSLRRWKRIVLLAGTLFLLTAAARPWWGYHRVNTTVNGRDTAVIFDVSKSMLAEDTAPSRLAHAKWLAGELAARRPGDRFALIPFAGRAVVLCPLTADQNTFRMFLDTLDCNAIPHGGTDIATALQTASRALEEAGGEEKAVLLITDGEELTGDAAAEAAKLRAAGITLLIVGIGSDTAAAPIPEPLPNGGRRFKKDASGNLVTTRLGSDLLAELAETADGKYFHSTAINDRLDEIDSAISQLQTRRGEDEFKTIPIERFMPFLAIGTLLLLAGLLMPERPAGKKAVLLLTPAFILPVFCGAAETQQQPAPMELFNKGVELHAADPAGAESFYQQALSSPELTPDVAANVLFNTGELRHREAREKESASSAAAAADVQAAISELDQALSILAAAAEAYTASLAEETPSGTLMQNNLAALNDDRERMEKQRENLEKLLQQQQQTQQQTQQAAEENQQQDSGEGQSQEQQNSARQSTADAAKSASSLADAARAAGAETMAEQAEKAAQKLQEAGEAQERNDYSEAAEKIEEALQELSTGSNSGDSGSSGQEQPDSDGEDGQSDSDPAATRRTEARNRSDALLQDMAEQEKELREAIKNNNAVRLQRPEKDW